MSLDIRFRDRYSRQTMFPGIGEEGQYKLCKGKVIIIGCGALGCNIANLLVRAGVGKVRFIDRDFIEYHNLQRQVLFDEEDIKKQLPKAMAAKRHLDRVNSLIDIEAIVADVNSSNVEEFCQGMDVILDGLDNIESRFLINDISQKLKIPYIYGGAISSTGMTMTIIPGKTACFRCVFPNLPPRGMLPTCETAGIIGTIPALIGALEATEAIKILTGAKEINRRLITIDVWDMLFEYFELKQREDCPACHGRYEYLDRKLDIVTTSLCGQSRAIQVLNEKINKINLGELAMKLPDARNLSCNEYMLRFNSEDYEITVFPDGRAIIKNTLDESTAKTIYDKYILSRLT